MGHVETKIVILQALMDARAASAEEYVERAVKSGYIELVVSLGIRCLQLPYDAMSASSPHASISRLRSNLPELERISTGPHLPSSHRSPPRTSPVRKPQSHEPGHAHSFRKSLPAQCSTLSSKTRSSASRHTLSSPLTRSLPLPSSSTQPLSCSSPVNAPSLEQFKRPSSCRTTNSSLSTFGRSYDRNATPNPP